MGADVDLEDCALALSPSSCCLPPECALTGSRCVTTDVQRPDKLSSAEISSICQAAGLQAVRKNRFVVSSSLTFFAPLTYIGFTAT